MAKLRRLNDRNQITIPPAILREAGVGHGALFTIDAKDGKIVLAPQKLVDNEYTEADFAAMDRLVKRELKAGRYKEFHGAKAVRKHLRGL